MELDDVAMRDYYLGHLLKAGVIPAGQDAVTVAEKPDFYGVPWLE